MLSRQCNQGDELESTEKKIQLVVMPIVVVVGGGHIGSVDCNFYPLSHATSCTLTSVQYRLTKYSASLHDKCDTSHI